MRKGDWFVWMGAAGVYLGVAVVVIALLLGFAWLVWIVWTLAMPAMFGPAAWTMPGYWAFAGFLWLVLGLIGLLRRRQ
jgi:hypothetical protein